MNTHPLSTLAQISADKVKALAEGVLEHIEHICSVQVIQNRTGIIMLPYTDSVKGNAFHLGEAMMAEAHVCLQLPPLLGGGAEGETTQVEGYGACLGRDLQQALAIAIVDAALRANIEAEWLQAFIAEQALKLRHADETLQHKVEATRVEMETF